MPYRQTLASGIIIAPTLPEHAEELEELQRVVFPDLADDERFKAPHYRKHMELFPEGQFVALDGEQVVGTTTAIRQSFDFDHPHHRFIDVIDGGWLTSHDPQGEWLYGMDIGTHPDYRRRGIARALYAARHDTVRRLGLRGQVTVGMLNGYHRYRDEMTIDEYFTKVKAGEISDPTVSTQQSVGFEIRVLVKDYLDDPTCGNAGALIVWPAERD